MIQMNNRVNRLVIYIDDEMKENLKKTAKFFGTSMSELGYDAIVEYLKSLDGYVDYIEEKEKEYNGVI